MFRFLRGLFVGHQRQPILQPELGPRFTLSGIEIASNVGYNVNRAIIQKATSLREKDDNGPLSETGFPLVTEGYIREAICELGLESYATI